MKKLMVLALVIGSLLMTGCGRNAKFGVVDMTVIEKDAVQLTAIRDEAVKELDKMNAEMSKELAGKTGKDREAVVQDYQARANVVQSSMMNRMRNQLEGAIHQVAQEKGLGAVLVKAVVPDGGTDITADVLNKLK